MILECWAHVEANIKQIIAYSARGIFHTGKYHECIQTHGMDYYLILLGVKGSGVGSINTAMCLPQACSTDLVKSGINMVLDKAKLGYEAVTVLNRTQDFHYPFDIPFFLTVLLLVVLMALVLIASCSKSFRHHPTIGVFSVQKSVTIFKYNPDSRLNVFNGVKALSMMWVIFGHVYSLGFSFAPNEMTLQKNQLSGWKALLMESGLFSVDTFFFVGGFLVAYAVLKEASLSFYKYPLAILNRYLRFLPSYLMAILIFYCLLLHFVWGPFSSLNTKVITDCDSIWRPLLFVDNLVDNGDNMCMGWGWYLQNDMQLFIYSILILMIYKSSRFWSIVSIYLSIACSYAFVFQQTYDHQYKNATHLSDFATAAQYQLDIYYKPWARCPPYLYGLFLGILYHQFLMEEKKKEEGSHFFISLKKKCQQNEWFRRLFEIFGVLLGCFICFIPRTAQGENHWSQLAHSFYLTYAKTIFVVAISFIILPSLICEKTTSLVKFMMDTKFFNFIAKISFWTYLIHLTLIFQYFMTRSLESYYDFWSIYPVFASIAFSSMIFAIFFVFLVEIPFSKLQRKYMHKLLTKKKQAPADHTSKLIEGKSLIQSLKDERIKLNDTTEESTATNKNTTYMQEQIKDSDEFKLKQSQ